MEIAVNISEEGENSRFAFGKPGIFAVEPVVRSLKY
jgi:hypothetical protein